MAIKLLIVTFTIPYPATDGGKISVFGSIEYLRKFFDITLVLRSFTDENLNDIEQLRKVWNDVHIEVVSYYQGPVSYKKRGLFNHILDKLRVIKNKLLPSGSSIQIEKKTFNEHICNDFTLLDEKFLDVLEKIFQSESFEIIQVEYTEYLSLINILPEKSIKVFVEIESRNALVKDYLKLEGTNSLYNTYLIKNTQLLEFEYMRRYDMIFALSENDVQRISYHLPGKNVELSPFCVLNDHIRDLGNIDFHSEKLVFLGSENHYPNKDALEWFIESIFPKILSKKEVNLYITGKWSTNFKEKYFTKGNVFFTGFLDNVNVLLENSVMIVPIRIGGGGLRAKVLQSMAFGVPIVSTTLGCDGIGAETEKHLLIADSETDFVNSVLRLLNDGELSKHLISNSCKLIDENYTMESAGEKRYKIYQKLLKERSNA